MNLPIPTWVRWLRWLPTHPDPLISGCAWLLVQCLGGLVAFAAVIALAMWAAP